LSHLLHDQILAVTVNYIQDVPSNMFVYECIRTACRNLTKLNFTSIRPYCFFNSSDSSCLSSTLMELHMKIFSFNDCLLFLNGCLPQLQIFCVQVEEERRFFLQTQAVIDKTVGKIVEIPHKIICSLRHICLTCSLFLQLVIPGYRWKRTMIRSCRSFDFFEILNNSRYGYVLNDLLS
jgi:hypothetical protein